MVSSEKNLSHQESLNIIAEAINKTTEHYRENSFYFLLWGWLVAAASFTFFILQLYGISLYFIPFPIAAVIGITTTIIYYNKQKIRHPIESYLSYYLSRLWLVLGITFIVVVFINVSQHHVPFTYTLIIAGIGTLVSGLVMKFKPMILGGILFLISSIASIFIAENYIVLLHGIAIITGYLIPGYLLKQSDK